MGIIASKAAALKALREVDVTPSGMTLGPVAALGGQYFLFPDVRSEDQRNALITTFKLHARDHHFASDGSVYWSKLLCSAKTKSRSRGMIRKADSKSSASGQRSKAKGR